MFALTVVGLLVAAGGPVATAEHGTRVLLVSDDPSCTLAIALDRTGEDEGVATWDAWMAWAGPDCGGAVAAHGNNQPCAVRGSVEAGFEGSCREGALAITGTSHAHAPGEVAPDVHGGRWVVVGDVRVPASLVAFSLG